MANQEASERPEPGNRPLDDIALTIDAQPPTILVRPIHPVVPVRTDERDAASGEVFPQAVTVVSAIGDQALWVPAVWRYARGERLIVSYRGTALEAPLRHRGAAWPSPGIGSAAALMFAEAQTRLLGSG